MTNRAFVIVPIAAALWMTGCAALPHEPNETYVLVSANKNNSYWRAAAAGLSHAAAEMKVKSEFVGPDSYDPKAERDELVAAIHRKPSGILVAAADAALLTPDIDSALQQGIPLITIDSDAPASKRLFFIGTDNYNAGRLGGQLLLKLLGEQGNVVMFTYLNQLNLSQRKDGYESVLSSRPGIKITQTIDIKGDPTVAFDTAKQLLDSKAKVDAFVCLVAVACPEIGEIVNRAKMGGKIAIIAMDTDPRTLEWIQKGLISATIGQKPFTMAYFGAKRLDDLHHNPLPSLTENFTRQLFSPLPAFIDTGVFLVNKDNVGRYIQENEAHGPSQ